MGTTPTEKQGIEAARSSSSEDMNREFSAAPSPAEGQDAEPVLDPVLNPRAVFLEMAACSLVAEADRLAGPSRPLWARMWYSAQAFDLARQARPLFNEARSLQGLPPMADFGMSESTWRKVVAAQWVCGIGNAACLITALESQSWFWAVVAGAGVFATAHWRIRRQAPSSTTINIATASKGK